MKIKSLVLFFVSALVFGLSTGCQSVRPGPTVYGPVPSLAKAGPSRNLAPLNWAVPIIGRVDYSGDIVHVSNTTSFRISISAGDPLGQAFLQPRTNQNFDLSEFGSDRVSVVHVWAEMPDGEMRPIGMPSFRRSRGSIDRYHYKLIVTYDNGQFRVRASRA